MGGTIDKDYPKTKKGYNFEIGQPAVEEVIKKIRPDIGFKYKIKTICKEDSQDITIRERYEVTF